MLCSQPTVEGGCTAFACLILQPLTFHQSAMLHHANKGPQLDRPINHLLDQVAARYRQPQVSCLQLSFCVGQACSVGMPAVSIADTCLERGDCFTCVWLDRLTDHPGPLRLAAHGHALAQRVGAGDSKVVVVAGHLRHGAIFHAQLQPANGRPIANCNQEQFRLK